MAVRQGGLDAIAAELRVPAAEVAFLADLDDTVREDLHRALVHARNHQERALREAFDGSVRLVPRPLRGRVRKLLLGD